MSDQHGVTINEDYNNFVPCCNAHKSVDRLLSGVPRKYLSGLKMVVLTNAGGLSRGKRRQKTLSRKRKVAIRDCGGLYREKWMGRPAQIEIFVDNVVKNMPPLLLRIPFFCDLCFAEVLFHELGHHIHRTQVPEFAEREDVAENWGERLEHYVLRRQYWYIFSPVRFVVLLVKRFKGLWIRKRSHSANSKA